MQAAEGKLLEEQSHLAYESIMPIKLIKSTFEQAAASDEVKSNLFMVSVDLVAEYLSEKITENTSRSPIKKLLGSALLFGFSYVVAENQKAIRSVGKQFMNIIIRMFANRYDVEENAEEETDT